MIPTNFKNDGRRFEDLFAKVAGEYMRRGILRLEKADPPTRVFGKPPNVKIVFQENPFADWVGSWTERGGRMLLIETKSTQGDKLAIGGKLTDKQIEWLLRWHSAGAITGVVWESDFKVGFLPIGRIKTIVDSGRRHIKFAEADPIPQGMGFIIFDFVQNLRHWYPSGNENAGTLAER
jgi:hypothetical protein